MASSSSTSLSSVAADRLGYGERLSKAHLNIASLPEELCPPSYPLSRLSSMRIEALSQRIMNAVAVAGGDTTNPKWGHVSRLVKMGCTSRGYVGAASGVKVGDLRKAHVKGVHFELPGTEEEWWEYEKRWADRALQGSEDQGRTSKYWNTLPGHAVEEGSGQPVRTITTKAAIVREKVINWQATIVDVQEDAPLPAEEAQQFKKSEKGKEKEKITDSTKSQKSLGFPVVKRSGVLKDKPTKTCVQAESGVLTVESEFASPADVAMLSPAQQGDHETVADADQRKSSPPGSSEQARISDLSEMLRTSTPQPADTAKPARQKPAPIAPIACLSSPLSSPPLTQAQSLPLHPQDANEDLQATSSSQPMLRPTEKAEKRARDVTPTANDIAYPAHELSCNSPPAKKARPAHESSSSAPPPPSTPPPLSSADHISAPVLPLPIGKVLGNAKGLPVPTTPERQILPTLTELLASSRRSKPRPRPPSRKLKTPRGAGKHKGMGAQSQDLPVLDEEEPSPTKTYLSSPASGSSDSSPSSTRHQPRSPVSPLFTQNPNAFAPRFVSSQPFMARGGDFVGVGSHNNLLARESSGFFGMGYNSQFDVDGRVERVSELLERDVDYDGWLRDIPDEHQLDPLTQSQGMEL
ncbi:hypothetical protein AcW2_003979 [Taiwanofungus camphoratus]|nr:hypothetical protein AcW2_003979 [Antrodia cinnamomea]